MENQALFSSKDKSKKLKCGLLRFLFGTLRVKIFIGENNYKYASRHKLKYNITKMTE